MRRDLVETEGEKNRTSMAVHADPSVVMSMKDELGQEWIARLTLLQQALTACPTDISARCELAALLEELHQHEEALFNWKVVLGFDPNNLKAREGLARCRHRAGLLFSRPYSKG